MRAAHVREFLVCLGAVLSVALYALVRVVLRFWQRVRRDEPVLRCIRELRWDGAWPAAAYRERLAARLRAQLGIGVFPYVAHGDRVDLSFDYQGTTWFIAVKDQLQNVQRKQVERDIATLLVECTERHVERPTVAVVVGVLSAGSHNNLQLRSLRAALVYGAARPPQPTSSEVNLAVVAVPLARTSIPPSRASIPPSPAPL
jgi:hypothetical protein